MAVTIVTTVGASTANSYLSVADATTYFNKRLGSSEWTTAGTTSPETQTTALAMAALWMEQETWAGRIADSDQALAWPRIGTVDKDGYSIDATTIPQVIKDAQCECALALLKDNDLLDDTGLEGFKSLEVGSLALETRVRSAGSIPAYVRKRLSHLLANASPYQFKMVRG